MGTGRKKGPGGGGGTSLNFNVKDYATEELLMAATGKVNEIGIITSTPMTGWHFAAEKPEMQPGEVWISTGTASQVAVNVLKKGGTVMVYPISAKQMGQNSTLVDVTAKSWQGGKWVEWITYLYKKGIGLESNFVSVSGVTISDTSITGNGQAAVRTAEKFDFDKEKKRKIIATVYMGSQTHAYPLNLVVTDYTDLSNFSNVNQNNPPVNAIAYSQIKPPVANAENTIELNIESVTGQHYIGVAMGFHSGSELLEIRFK